VQSKFLKTFGNINSFDTLLEAKESIFLKTMQTIQYMNRSKIMIFCGKTRFEVLHEIKNERTQLFLSFIKFSNYKRSKICLGIAPRTW